MPRYNNMTICEEMAIWVSNGLNYFSIGHGKGEVDGVGALLKKEIQKKQVKLNARRLQDASNIVVIFLLKEFVRQHVVHPNVRRTMLNTFGRSRKMMLTYHSFMNVKQFMVAAKLTRFDLYHLKI
jgi:ABC-type anion transport system duplicated permease subunit